MKLALGLDVQTNAKGGKFMSIEDSHQGALVCKVDVEVLWEPGNFQDGPRGWALLCEQHQPGAVDGGGGAGRHRQHDHLPEALSRTEPAAARRQGERQGQAREVQDGLGALPLLGPGRQPRSSRAAGAAPCGGPARVAGQAAGRAL